MRSASCRDIADRVGKWANVTQIIMGICFVILFFLGLALLIASAIALANVKTFEQFPITGFKEIIIFALCLGIFVSLVSIVGAMGFFTLNKTLLIIFVTAISLLVILQIACGITAFSYRNKYDDIIATAWNHTEDSSRAYMEHTFHCCGGVDEFNMPAADECLINFTSSSSAPPPVPPVASSSSEFPLSSEEESSDSSSDDMFTLPLFGNEEPKSSSASAYANGCVPLLAEFAKDKIVAVGIGDIVITVLEVAVVVVTIVVLVKISMARNQYERFTGGDTTIDQLRSW